MLKLLLPHPAAMIKTGKTTSLVIADPHIGWEMALQERGIHIPSQTPKLLQKLTTLLSEYTPDELLVLGDVKYSVVPAASGEWHDVPDFFTELKNHVRSISIIRGNHDANLEPMLPEKVEILPATGILIGHIGLFHGHKWPSPMLLRCKTLIMGHLHPVVVFRDLAGFKVTRQVWMKVACNAEALAQVLLKKHGVKIEGSVAETLLNHYKIKARTEQIFMMPSFNDFLGGRPVNEKRGEALIGPVLRAEAIDVENSELYLLDGTYLGTVSQLRRL